MPQLEGVSGNVQTLRTYATIRVSMAEFNGMSGLEMARRTIEQLVKNICLGCVSKGYYIVGLERGNVDMFDRNVSDALDYQLSVSLFVRRFSMKLTNDELYEYASRMSDALLFQISQLNEFRGLGPPGTTGGFYLPKFTEEDKRKAVATRGAIDPATGLGFQPEIVYLNIGATIADGVTTGTASAIQESQRAQREEATSKLKQYKIIRHKRCSSGNS